MKKYISIFFLLICTLWNFGFRGFEKPNWVKTSGVHNSYSDEKYIKAYAKSKKRGKIESKKEYADAEVVKLVLEEYKSRITYELIREWLVIEGFSFDKIDNELLSQIKEEIILSIEKNRENITIVERFYDKKTKIFHSLAVLNREKIKKGHFWS